MVLTGGPGGPVNPGGPVSPFKKAIRNNAIICRYEKQIKQVGKCDTHHDARHSQKSWGASSSRQPLENTRKLVSGRSTGEIFEVGRTKQ